jgi:hypothetical protein
MHFMAAETDGRKFQCINCDGLDPLRLPHVQNWLASGLQPPKNEATGKRAGCP